MKAPEHGDEPVVRKLLEKDIEKKGNDYAKSRGWLVRKFKSPGHSGVMDRIYCRTGKAIFVEWKKPGGKLSKLQELEIAAFRRAGMEVYVLDSCDPVTLSLIFD